MRFRILGPLEVSDRGQALPVGAVRERTTLAVLLLRANRVVSVADLIDALWPDGPPTTARQQIQTAVSVLRRSLGDAGRGGSGRAPADRRIVTCPPGYLLRVEPTEVDADEFVAAHVAGRAELLAGHPDRAARRLRDALDRWSGRALDGIAVPAVRAAADALDERRVTAVEDLAEAELAAGRYSDLVTELTTLVAEHPFRDRLRAALMRALYRMGRQADALRVYREGRGIMAAELGLEPGHRLQELERAILRADPRLLVDGDRPAFVMG